MHLNHSTRKWLPWLLLAIAVIATALVYWPGLTGGWVFDDYPNIVDNAAIHITSANSTLAAWVSAALSSPASFLHRPLASITFALNWYAGGGDPWPFKLTNVVIHLINGVLLYCMLRTLLRLMGLRAASSPRRWRADPLLTEGGESETGDSHKPARSPVVIPGLPEGQNPESTIHDGRSKAKKWIPDSVREEATDGSGMTNGEDDRDAIDDTAATRLALIVSAAWMLLPINLMAVLYVVQRMESLCQVFVLAGLWAYLYGRWMMLTARDRSRETRGFSLAATGIVLGTLLGLTSKETAVLLPVFAFLAEVVVLRFAKSVDLPQAVFSSFRTPRSDDPESIVDPSRAEEKWIPGSARTQRGQPRNDERTTEATATGTDKRLWTLFTVTLFIPAVLGFLWLLRSALQPAAWVGRDFTLAQRLLTEPRVLVDYLHWTLLPNPLVLSLYHDEIVKSTGILAPWTTLGAMLLLAALIVVAVLLRNRRPLVALGIGWFFAAQLLTATIVPLELVYEQRMYFASIGVLLAAGALLLGLRWRIRLPLLRGFIVAIAVLWFGTATLLRAQEWSNPLRLAIAEANRHPESPRAVYEAGRLLLIASNYQPGARLEQSWKYLRKAAALPGSSALADQAMIMLADHQHQGDDGAFWDSMIHKLRNQPTRQEDISALISLTNCYGSGICKFDLSNLQRAYQAALSRPHPIARLNGAYADFQRDLMHNDTLATEYLARAVKGAPSEPAYREDLAVLYARQGQTEKALEQIDALRRMNLAGRLDNQIATLERMAEQGKNPTH